MPLHPSYTSNRLTAVLLADCPLGLLDSESKAQLDNSKAESDGALTFDVRGKSLSTFGKRKSIGMSSCVELAKGFQSAYINASLFSVTMALDPRASRAQPQSSSSSRLPPRTVKKQGGWPTNIADRTLKPTGYHVLSSDVCAFAAPTPETLATPTDVIHFIPLISPFLSANYSAF
jgi:hypothetical protein